MIKIYNILYHFFDISQCFLTILTNTLAFFVTLLFSIRKEYDDTFTTVEENKKLSDNIDVSSFVLYFIYYVYNKMNEGTADIETPTAFDEVVK